MAKLDRQGNIIRQKKPEEHVTDTKKPSPTDLNPQEQEREQKESSSIPVFYEFSIRCITTTPVPGIDMDDVCKACPFKKTTCVDTMLLPTDAQIEDIAKILMHDTGE